MYRSARAGLRRRPGHTPPSDVESADSEVVQGITPSAANAEAVYQRAAGVGGVYEALLEETIHRHNEIGCLMHDLDVSGTIPACAEVCSAYSY